MKCWKIEIATILLRNIVKGIDLGSCSWYIGTISDNVIKELTMGNQKETKKDFTTLLKGMEDQLNECPQAYCVGTKNFDDMDEAELRIVAKFFMSKSIGEGY
ncbi:MAG: hypothetical protein KAS32_16625 [Candidatus Peribacteraceae bacterium]|nr:hypothetical protein [Candidatus Peribacteraceae bacterium]